MLSLTQVPRGPWLSGCCWFDPTSHERSLGFLCGLLRVMAAAPRAPSSRASEDLCFTRRSCSSAWTAPDCHPGGNGCLLCLDICGYLACRQSSSQHLQLQGTRILSLVSFACLFLLGGFHAVLGTGSLQTFFPLEKFSKYLPFLFLAVKQIRHRFPRD